MSEWWLLKVKIIVLCWSTNNKDLMLLIMFLWSIPKLCNKLRFKLLKPCFICLVFKTKKTPRDTFAFVLSEKKTRATNKTIFCHVPTFGVKWCSNLAKMHKSSHLHKLTEVRVKSMPIRLTPNRKYARQSARIDRTNKTIFQADCNEQN